MNRSTSLGPWLMRLTAVLLVIAVPSPAALARPIPESPLTLQPDVSSSPVDKNAALVDAKPLSDADLNALPYSPTPQVEPVKSTVGQQSAGNLKMPATT